MYLKRKEIWVCCLTRDIKALISALTYEDFLGGAVVRIHLLMQEMEEMYFNPWFWKILWRRHGNPLQYSCLGNPMDRGASWAPVHVVINSRT